MPVDYQIIAVNPAYEKRTGFDSDHLLGRKITEIIPGIENDCHDWIATYGEIALKGGTKEFKRFFDSVNEYENLKIYSPQKEYFITMFDGVISQDERKESFDKEDLSINDIIDIPEIQMLADEFNKITNIAMAIGNKKGDLIIQSGFQDICKNFHRKNPISNKNCIESDVKLFDGVFYGRPIKYKCLNNMWDIATPIIIEGKILGSVYLGQFIYDDDFLDYKIFKKQAKLYGYDEKSYLRALDKVPVVSHGYIEKVMNFYVKFANIVALLGYKNLNIKTAKEKQDKLLMYLRESEKKFKKTLEKIPDTILLFDKNNNILYANQEILKISGKSASYFIGKKADKIWDRDNAELYLPSLKKAMDTNISQSIEIEVTYSKYETKNLKITFIPVIEDKSDLEIIGVIHDDTERKKIDKERMRQDNLIKEMGEVAKIGGWEINTVSGEIAWSDEVKKIHDCNPQEPMDVNDGVSFYVDDSKVKIENAIKAAVEYAKPYDIEAEIITAKGKKKWVRTIGIDRVKLL